MNGPAPVPRPSPPSAGGAGRGAQTVLVSGVDIGPQLQQPPQARQSLGLLAGQIQGTALMDLQNS